MTTPPPIDMQMIQRKIREMEQKLKVKSRPLPQASPEHWPGQGTAYGDFQLASRKRKIRRAAIA